MGRFDRTCDIDTFSMALDSILAEVDKSIQLGTEVVVENAAKKGRKLVKKPAGWHQGVTAKRYKSGWQFKVTGKGREVEAEIGNKNTPGLPHLLEFGHAKVGGGRTTAYEHVGTAAKEAFDYTLEEMGKMIERALR